MVHSVAEKEKGVQFVRADAAGNLPFADNSIDYATLEFVVHHVSEEGLTNIIFETQRVLKPGGILFVGPQEFNYDEPDNGHWRALQKMHREEGDSLERLSLKDIQ